VSEPYSSTVPALPADGAQSAVTDDVRLAGVHYAVLATIVLGLAAFNLTFRLGREFVTEWDESLYAISAKEMVASGHWIGVTFFGALDYYNTKPPLNVWLIALAFKTLGRGIESLRLASVASAWLTVAVLMMWSRRAFGSAVAILAGAILATTFGFLHVHSGRSANTDALFTLLVLLTVVTLWAEERQIWHRLWLGPLLAAAFLLRGPAVLMPLAIVIAVLAARGDRIRWLPSLGASLLFIVPVAIWAIARYNLDRWEFLERMFTYDFVARSVRVLDEHPGGPLYYPRILFKHQYDWAIAGLAAAVLFPASWSTIRRLPRSLLRDDTLMLVAVWTAATLFIPTAMQTKLPWYLNTFYPVFALGVAALLVRGFSIAWTRPTSRWRVMTLALVTVVALAVAEVKLWSYSVRFRDLDRSAQGLLLSEPSKFAGHRVFRDRFDRSATFVAGLVGVELQTAIDVEVFLRESRPGDFLLVSGRHPHEHDNPALEVVASNVGNRLYRRVPGDGHLSRRPSALRPRCWEPTVPDLRSKQGLAELACRGESVAW
jgi:4-amino-4-deoxy-L-arabinose transferase-like glycosyltransferase